MRGNNFSTIGNQRFHMDFFYCCSPITTKVSVEIVDDDEPDPLFFDYANIGSEVLKSLFPGPLSDLAINITSEPVHPAFQPNGLISWAVSRDSKVRRETPPSKLPHNLAQHCSMDVHCASLPHCYNMLSTHHSSTSLVKSLLFCPCP